MSTSDQIFLRTGLPPREVAERLSNALGATLHQEPDGSVFVGVSVAGDGVREVGGEVGPQIYGPVPDPDPDEMSVVDDYDIEWTIAVVPRDDDALHRWADDLFRQVASRLPWPAILVRNLQSLVAMSQPGKPIIEFPPGTSLEAVPEPPS